MRPKAGSKITESIGLAKWARKDNVAEQSEKQLEEERQKSLAPVGSLMFAEVERRIDVVIFRACLASSVYEARRLIVHGDVLLNGKKVRVLAQFHRICVERVRQHQDANTRLAPGDMVSVKPEAVRFIQRPQKKVKAKAAKSEDAEEDAEETEVEQWTEQTRPPTASADPAKPPSSYAKKKAGSDLTYFRLPPFAAPWIFIPAYIETQFTTCSAIYLRHPTARPGYSEIPTPYDADGEHVRFAWEWYVRRRPRIRSKSQLARMPTNRQ